jgi:methylthioribose-1-phosphate isomerase
MTSAGTGVPSVVRPLLAESVLLTEDGVDILDRRVFPFERTWVHCATVEDVATAIEDMVTQSSGPMFAATAGMVLAAREAARLGPGGALDHLRSAGRRIVATRPTNNAIRDAVAAVLAATEGAETTPGEQLVPLVARAAAAHDQAYRDRSVAMGRHAAALLPDGAAVLTHCWADWYLVATVEAAQAAGKELGFLCTETRPYLQGARLTAATLVEMGYEPTLITDGMVAATMARGLVDLVVVAADRVTMDGHVVNKVGTLQAALAAKAFDLPFLALVHAPDPQSPGLAGVEMEERDGEEVLHVAGQRTAAPGVRGYYPAFDATPPDLVTRIVTAHGAFEPARVADHFSGETTTTP